MIYLIAINTYRSSTDDGFANTWEVAECESRAHQYDLLNNGLGVSDSWYEDGTPVRSTMGIRAVTERERRAYNREIEMYGNAARRYVPGPTEDQAMLATEAANAHCITKSTRDARNKAQGDKMRNVKFDAAATTREAQADHEHIIATVAAWRRLQTPEAVRALRVRLQWSQSQLADALGLSKRSIGRMEHGDQAVTRQTAQMLHTLDQYDGRIIPGV